MIGQLAANHIVTPISLLMAAVQSETVVRDTMAHVLLWMHRVCCDYLRIRKEDNLKAMC